MPQCHILKGSTCTAYCALCIPHVAHRNLHVTDCALCAPHILHLVHCRLPTTHSTLSTLHTARSDWQTECYYRILRIDLPPASARRRLFGFFGKAGLPLHPLRFVKPMLGRNQVPRMAGTEQCRNMKQSLMGECVCCCRHQRQQHAAACRSMPQRQILGAVGGGFEACRSMPQRAKIFTWRTFFFHNMSNL